MKKLIFIALVAFTFSIFNSALAQSAPSVSIYASDVDLAYGDSTDIYFSPIRATACVGTGGNSGWPGSKYHYSSSYYTGEMYQTATFVITCTNAYGSATNSVTIYVAGGPVTFPTVDLTVDQVNLSYNGSTTIRWNTTNAQSCIAGGGSSGWAGTKNIPNGTFNTGAITSTTTYTLTCTNASGSDTKTITINVGTQGNTNPTVTTSSATNVGNSNATLNGYVNANGGSNVSAWFEWGLGGNLYNQTNKVNYGSTSGTSYNYALSGLSPSTTYSFRAVAQASNGQIIYGSQMTFTTTSSGGCLYNCGTNTPSVTTYGASSIADTYATLNGYVNPNGGDTTRWFEWGTSSSNLYNQTIKINQGTTSGNISQSLSGLSPNNVYYFRAVAQNSNGVSYGNIMNFTTINSYNNQNTCTVNVSCTPTAITTLATNIDHNSARLNGLGIVSNNLSGVSNNGYFEWGVTQSLGNTTNNGFIGSSDSNPFYSSLFGLTPNTTYYYRAVVTNQYGTSRGEMLTFRTGNITVVSNTPTTITNVVYRDRIVVQNVSDGTGVAKPSLVFLNIQNNGETIAKGSTVNYVVYYKNVSGKNLKDAVLTVLFPKELQFVETNRGYFSAENNTVVVNIGELSSLSEGSVTIKVNVTESAQEGKILVVTANLGYTIVESNAQEEVFAYSKNEVVATSADSSLTGLAFFGAGFWPDTLIGWLLLILVIALIIFAIRKASGGGSRAEFTPISNRTPR